MLNYRVKVLRPAVAQRTYLWGGRQLEKNTEADVPLVLTFRVDEFGEPVRIGTTKHPASSSNSDEALGTLNPGEVFSVALGAIVGVFAESVTGNDSFVECFIGTVGAPKSNA